MIELPLSKYAKPKGPIWVGMKIRNNHDRSKIAMVNEVVFGGKGWDGVAWYKFDLVYIEGGDCLSTGWTWPVCCWSKYEN